ncbi:MAG TPA: hypothetical protein VJU77_15990 [Chthoniobacterales bacterium]|nr:hypothetical protein [Chthoniobacterales bacterium]
MKSTAWGSAMALLTILIHFDASAGPRDPDAVAAPGWLGTPLVIPGNANIFGAGHSSPPEPGGGGAGLLPVLFRFVAGSRKILTFSDVGGQVAIDPAHSSGTGPDGVAINEGSIILPYGGISGFRASTSGCLVGVFLGPAEPKAPAPKTLDFSSTGEGTAFPRLTPEIGQIFFIGDGLTGTKTGNLQKFEVPPSATRLYLGLADSGDRRKETAPGYYSDNTGAFSLTAHMATMLPPRVLEEGPVRLRPEDPITFRDGRQARLSRNQLFIRGANGKTVRAAAGRYETKDGHVIVVDKQGTIRK